MAGACALCALLAVLMASGSHASDVKPNFMLAAARPEGEEGPVVWAATLIGFGGPQGFAAPSNDLAGVK